MRLGAGKDIDMAVDRHDATLTHGDGVRAVRRARVDGAAWR
jgi:hypothetical protein